MTDNTKTLRVSVGTIGHVDHGKTTLIQALSKFAGEILVVDGAESQIQSLMEINIHTHRDERYWSKRRKKERKARLAELQRKAFEGGHRP